MGEFQPEFAGKMNFYLAAVDDKLQTEGDNPSIGLILCRGKNGLIVEYALRDLNKPMVVSEYTVLPPSIANALLSQMSWRPDWRIISTAPTPVTVRIRVRRTWPRQVARPAERRLPMLVHGDADLVHDGGLYRSLPRAACRSQCPEVRAHAGLAANKDMGALRLRTAL